MNILDPIGLPLNQNSLIEASAGTGKTFTITTLYLRAILGVTNEDTVLSPLSIEQILVVTFTEAATKELRERIRGSLKTAQQLIMAWPEVDKTAAPCQVIEQFLNNFLQSEQEACEQDAIMAAYHRLDDAITLMDEASIFTIHGFCQRCLSQFVFETGGDFEQQLENNPAQVWLSSSYDFWRQFAVELKDAEFEWFKRCWSTPQTLQKQLQAILNKDCVITPNLTEKAYEQLLEDYKQQLLAVKKTWIADDFVQFLNEQAIKKTSKTYKRLSAMNTFMMGDKWICDSFKDHQWQDWGTVALNSNLKKGAEQINHQVLTLIDQLAETEQLLRDGFKGYWLTKAKLHIETNSQRIKQQQQIRHPDDLLLDLQQALTNEQSSAINQAIAAKYPLAFIDEFQDTDPVQFAIFSSLFGVNQSANMVLIGDPKQAIYKFRGADIHTYLTAKNGLDESHHFTLVNNWRSHPNLINGLNSFFGRIENPFLQQKIPYIQVSPGKQQPPELQVEGHPLAKFSLNYLPQLDEQQAGFDRKLGESMMAKWVAQQVNQLFEQKAQLVDSKITKAVQGGDICILVRNRNQAKRVKSALNQYAIRSVFITRDSIFSATIAHDFYHLLLAIHNPNDEQLIRNATAGVFFGYSLTQMIQLQQNDQWQHHLQWFYQAHQLWQQGHLASAINYLVECAGSYQYWQQHNADEFDRLLTDLRHLVELTQQQSALHNGAEKVLLWFKLQLQQVAVADELELRLESDEDLVQIVTMHGSKGLEYPIVFMPFVSDVQIDKQALFTDKRGQLTLRVDNRQLEMQQTDRERLAEDIRLIYVAMTRAVSYLAVGLFNLVGKESFSQTGFAHLLIPDDMPETLSQQDIQQACETINLVNDCQFSMIELNTEATKLDTKLPEQSITWAEVDSVTHDINDWSLLSYSALTHHGHTSTSVFNELKDDEFESHEVIEQEQVLSPFNFPKGAQAGTCLHEILELLDFCQPVEEQVTVIETKLAQFGIGEQYCDMVCQWMQQILLADLDTWQLASVTDANKLVEMEFYFNFERLNEHVLNNALLMMGLPKQLFSKVINKVGLHGVLKGFIDLTVQHHGKYYVLDYKSNYLGDTLDCYQNHDLEKCMSDHNYYLQALIYVLALHRFLKQKLTDYSYEQHIGGGKYLFLRGMSQQQQQGVYHIQIDKKVIDYLDAALAGEEHKLKIAPEQVTSQIGFDFNE